MSFWPRTLLVRTFLLISLLIVITVAIWLTLFNLAEREPRARHLAQLTASVANLTRAALLAADPQKRRALLVELAEREGIHLYPAEPGDNVTPLPDDAFFRLMRNAAQAQLGSQARFAGSVNGEPGLWVSFYIDEESRAEEDLFWVMLPAEHAKRILPWHFLGWGAASLLLALLVAWLIVSHVARPLRMLARAAAEVGRGSHPQPVAVTGSLEMQQLAAAFNRMSDDLRRNDAERAEVLAGISHDLRTPLARLRLEAELSISDHSARAAVEADIEQMDSIVGQFLHYARGESDETPLRSDINALITQTVSSTRRATTPDLMLDDLPAALIRPQALQRALRNLLDNADKYGSGARGIQSHCQPDASGRPEIVIEIIDHGSGIPESERERLKQPFTRLDTARGDANGTGLGLAIVERIARLHGGRLELLPRPGGGLIARLHLALQTTTNTPGKQAHGNHFPDPS